MRFVVSLFAVIFAANTVQAHVVTWEGNSMGTNGSSQLTVYYGPGAFAIAQVEPEKGEPCTVVVGLNQSSSSLVSATVFGNGLNTVYILISVLRPPNGTSESALITGVWAATGYPPLSGCNGSSTFTIPITVVPSAPPWKLAPGPTGYSAGVWITPGFNCTLARASSPAGPWYNIGMGNRDFYVYNDMMAAFFERKTELAGYLSGQVVDAKGNPKTGVTVDYLCGGMPATTDSTGAFVTADKVAMGVNTMTISSSDGAVLPIEVSTVDTDDDDTEVEWYYQEDSNTNIVVTNVCNCTPWAAIGFGYSSSGQTPLYYSGGANMPKTGASCGTISVTLTSPSGANTPVMPGTGHRQNVVSPASGLWTVTTTVCGLIKTVSIDVP
jgi:hypothetical protein